MLSIALLVAWMFTGCGKSARTVGMPLGSHDAGGAWTATETGGGATPVDQKTCSKAKATDLFNKRIAPLLKPGQPKSCNQCHLAGVDLSLFLSDTPCRSMACLLSKGLVDTKTPEASELIAMVDKGKPLSDLITPEVLAKERQGLIDWIIWSDKCHEEVCGDIEKPCGIDTGTKPPMTLPMLGQCSEDDLLAVFQARVWSWRDRCSSCHAPVGGPAEGNKPNPEAGPLFMRRTQEVDGPIYTMYQIIGTDLINLKQPEASLLLTKPLKVSAGGVPHGGHDKFQSKSDKNYQNGLAWIKHYADCHKGVGCTATCADDPNCDVSKCQTPVKRNKVDACLDDQCFEHYGNCDQTCKLAAKCIAGCHEKGCEAQCGATKAAMELYECGSISGCYQQGRGGPSNCMVDKCGAEVNACVGPCLKETDCAFSCAGHSGCVEGCDLGDEAKAVYDCGIEKGCK